MDVKRSFWQWMLMLAWAALFSGGIFAQKTIGAHFLQMELGSRAQALGGAATALPHSANSIYYNPGISGFTNDRELMLYHAQWFSEISIENATIVLPVNGRLTFAGGISFLRMPEMQRYDVDPFTGDPLADGNFNAYNMLITTGISVRLSENVSLGTNLKFLQESLEDVNARGFAGDVGLLLRMFERRMQLGFAMQNLGPDMQYQAEKSALPRIFRAGVAYRLGFPGSLLALDMVKVTGQPARLRPGMEFGMNGQIWLRGGYQSNGAGSGLTAGFGMKFLNDHQLNYAYAPYGELGDTHRAELIIHLGSVSEPSQNYVTSAKTETTGKAKTAVNQQAAAEAAANLSLDLSLADPPAMPTELKLENLGDQRMKLSWKGDDRPQVGYHIYAKPVDGNDWVRVTKSPVMQSYQLFTQKRAGLHLLIAVSAIIGDTESPRSSPVAFQSP